MKNFRLYIIISAVAFVASVVASFAMTTLVASEQGISYTMPTAIIYPVAAMIASVIAFITIICVEIARS